MLDARTVLLWCFALCYVAANQVDQSGRQTEGLVNDISQTAPHEVSHPETNPSLRRATSACLGYELVDGLLGYYKVHEDKQNWFNAKQMCEQEGAHLFVINSQREAVSVRNMIQKGGKNDLYYWIGFHDSYEEGNYVTIFNESLNTTGYAVWGYEEPDRRSGEDCGVFGSFEEYDKNKFNLGDWLCTVHLPYICEEESAIPSLPEEGKSLEGYDMIPYIGYYKLNQNRKNWQEAVDICKQEGGHLIIIESEPEERALWNLLKVTESFLFCFWTGVHDQYEEGSYVTIFNETAGSNINWWGTNFPTTERHTNCLDFCYGTLKRGSSAKDCNSTNLFICEHEI